MATRPALLAAVAATVSLSPAWEAAVRALGAAARAGWPKPPGRPTGLSRGELFARMLRSHVFDGDRASWQQRWWQAPNAGTFDEMKRTLDERKLAEKQAAPAA